MTALVVQIGCIHAGSTVAVCAPAITLPDAGTYRASKAQLKIWQVWGDFWDTVKAARGRGRGKKRLIIIINGEVIDNDHHDTPQLISRSQVSQMRVAHRVFEPVWKLKPDDVYVIRGTEAHSGKNGQWDEEFARDIEAHPDEETGTHSWWWLPLLVENVLFDIAHHGRGGYRPWTAPNGANNIAAQLVMDYARSGDRLPDVALRGHIHWDWDSGDNFPIRVLHNPSWQLSTAFGQRIAPGQIMPIGGNIFTIAGDSYTVDKVRYWPKRRSPVEA